MQTFLLVLQWHAPANKTWALDHVFDTDSETQILHHRVLRDWRRHWRLIWAQDWKFINKNIKPAITPKAFCAYKLQDCKDL